MATKKGLGKGLGSLLGDVADINRPIEEVKNEETPEAGEQMVKLRLVEPNRDQPRKDFSEDALSELADSIRTHGVIQPLIVTKKGAHYVIIAGERRWRAAKLAGLHEVPVIVKEYSDEEIAEISLIENIQRQDLNPMEEAAAYEKLLTEFHLTQEVLSERLGKNRSVIANMLRLLKLPEPVQLLVQEGKLSTGHAKVILSLDGAQAQEEAAKAVISRNLSVRETEKLVRDMQKPKKEPGTPVKNDQLSGEYDRIEKKLKEMLGTKVSIKRSAKNTGKIEIDFYSVDDFERILKHLH